MKKIISIISGLLVTFLVILPVYSEGESRGQAGTTLSANVNVTPKWERVYGWTIDKSVTPNEWNLFKGDSGTSRYTITLTKDSGTEGAWVEGEVCVTNGGGIATEDLAINIDLKNGYPPPNDVLVEDVPVDVSENLVLDPGETGCYHYKVDIPITGGAYPQPKAGGTYKVTANVTITNHSGHLGEAFGPSPSATTVFPSSPTVVNDKVHVSDTNIVDEWEFSTSGSVKYDRKYTCDTDEGKHDNIAIIKETSQSDSDSVTVNCYELEVTKNVVTSFDRNWDWTIEKTGDQEKLTLSEGKTFDVGYKVTLSAESKDSNWEVSGGIEVYNPAPIDAEIKSITDLVSPNISAVVDCGEIEFPYILKLEATLTCTYTADLPNGESRTNTATANIQNYDYDSVGGKIADGTTNFTGTAEIKFGSPSEIDECVDVTDDIYGDLGEVCAGDSLKTFEYTRTVGPYAECGSYKFINTASFVTNDTETSNSDSWTVDVNVPCGGCTLTQGYWKTHSKYGPAPYDDTWALIGEDTAFFSSGKSWYQVLWTAPKKGDAYFILAHQYIAARLNILNGASPTSEVNSALAFAGENGTNGFFNTYDPAKNLSKSVRSQAIYYAGVLGSFNEGIIGPGHCSE